MAFNRCYLSDESDLVAPIPPAPLMERVSGLTSRVEFASHGCDLSEALSASSPKSMKEFQRSSASESPPGRLARMFKGVRGTYVGADIDHELLGWVVDRLPWVTTVPTTPRQPLPTRRRPVRRVIGRRGDLGVRSSPP